MTQEDVIVLWKDANGWDVRGYKTTLEDLERFAKLVAAKEREACAQLAENTNRMVLALLNVTRQPKHIAAAIRARGEQA